MPPPTALTRIHSILKHAVAMRDSDLEVVVSQLEGIVADDKFSSAPQLQQCLTPDGWLPIASLLGLIFIGKLGYDLVDKDLRPAANTLLLGFAVLQTLVVGLLADLIVRVNRPFHRELPSDVREIGDADESAHLPKADGVPEKITPGPDDPASVDLPRRDR